MQKKLDTMYPAVQAILVTHGIELQKLLYRFGALYATAGDIQRKIATYAREYPCPADEGEYIAWIIAHIHFRDVPRLVDNPSRDGVI